MKVWEILSGMINFASEYCMDKCVRTMFVGMLIMPFIFLIRACNRSKRADINYYAMFLLLPAGISGMNKLFYLSKSGLFTVFLCYYIKPIHGKIYFGVMTILMGRFMWNNLRMKRRVRKLPVWESPQLTEAIDFAAEDDWSGWSRKYLSRVKVYVTSEHVSPFSGGLLHPYVVMPEQVLTEWPQAERRIALCHEFAHIKSGHIFWTVWFQLLKIYWWINPLIYLCEKYFRDDMEMVCDEKCIHYAGISCHAYGRTLLNMITLMQGTGVKGTLCFAGRNDFRNIRERIISLSRMNGAQTIRERSRRCATVFTAVVFSLLLVTVVTSYPKYTVMDEIFLYDEEQNMLDNDSEKLRGAVSVTDGKLVIDQKKFQDILTEKNVQGDYVYVSFDTIMKVPGAGGCGNTGMVAVTDYNDIFYLAAEGIECDIQRFWLKYLI